MRCSGVIWVGCCWATGAWAGPLPLDQRLVAEPEARVSLVEVAPVAQSGPAMLATAWLSDAPPTQAADLALVPAGLPADGTNPAQADPVWIVAVAAGTELPAETGRWLSREWTSLPADHRSLPDAVHADGAPLELPRPAVMALGMLVAGVAVAVVARLWLRSRPARPLGPSERHHHHHHRARLNRH